MNNEAANNPGAANEPQSVIDFGKILRTYLRHWWLFAISLIVCVGCAYLYVKSTPKVYLVKSLIMFNQEEVGGVGKSGSLTAMIGMLGSSDSDYANPENEIMKLSSNTNLTAVVNQLHLQYSYYLPGKLMRPEKNLYPKSPIAINMPQAIIDTISVGTEFEVSRKPGDKDFDITVRQKGKLVSEASVPKLPYSAKTPYGTFTITLTKFYNPNEPLEVKATAISTMAAVEKMLKAINFTYLSKKADAVQIDLEESNTVLGRDIVNTVMANYNNTRHDDRINHNRATLDFIEDRLLSIYRQLEQEDGKMEEYKRNRRIVNADAEATYIFNRMGALDEKYLYLSTRLENYRLFRDMLMNPATRDNQIPFTSNEMSGSESFGKYMLSYNDLLNQRMTLESTAKPGNRQLEVLNQRIKDMRESIITSLNREITNTSQSLNAMKSELAQRDSRIAEIPSIEHRLTSFERDRLVQNQIYAYLLQKREETQLDLMQTAPVGKIIDPAYFETKPISPKKMLVLAIAIVLGLMIPSVGLQMYAGKKDEKKAPAPQKA